jgi:hypothetical protein
MIAVRQFLLPALLLSALPSCAFHSTATEFNRRVGVDGYPVFYTTTTKAGAKLFIAVPFLGRMGIDGMVNDMTREIASRDGDRVRIVQGSTENYWYGFPPFTWIITPVVSTMNAEYRPSEAEMLEALVHQVRDEEGGLPPERVTEIAEERLAAWLEETGNAPR